MDSTARITKQLKHLRRMRWGVFAGVVVGIVVSIAMNVLHAEPEFIAQAIAAWPPLALFGGLELISRIPSSNRWLSAGRIVGTLAVAGVAGSISYGHMYGAVSDHGETGWQASIWPISVDGLMLVASLSLVEVVAKVRQLEATLEAAAPATATVATPAQTVAVVNVPTALPAPRPIPVVVPATARPLPIAPMRPAPAAITAAPRAPRRRAATAASSRTTVSANVVDSDINPRTGKAWSVRTMQRRRTGR